MPALAVNPPAADAGAPGGVGLYGKLPARGDFLTRRLPRDFVDAWDRWLQEVMDATRQATGEAWTEAYLTFPIWRFLLPAGTAGGTAMAGVLLPSTDRVGRCFPLTLATPLPELDRPMTLACAAGPWFERLEQLAYAALDEAADLGVIDAGLAGLSMPPAPSPPTGDVFPLDGSADPAPAAAALADRAIPPGHGLWWTGGSARVPAALLLVDGLPGAALFARLIGTAAAGPETDESLAWDATP